MGLNNTIKIDKSNARAILSEVAAGGWLDGNIPEDENEVLNKAKYYVLEAYKWIEQGNPEEPHILAIINLAKASPPVLSESAVITQHEETPPGEIKNFIERGGEMTPEDWKIAAEDEWVYTEEPVAKKFGWDHRDYEGLPLPKTVEEAVPYEMPSDLTDIGDKELRRLYSVFNSYSGRARWRQAQAVSNLANATHLRDEAYRVEYLAEFRGALIREEKLSQATLDMLAKDSKNYKSWYENVAKHENEVTQWKALVDIYSKNVEVLSREWTMRTEQYERER
jgi:hypothetical protein